MAHQASWSGLATSVRAVDSARRAAQHGDEGASEGLRAALIDVSDVALALVAHLDAPAVIPNRKAWFELGQFTGGYLPGQRVGA